MKYHLHDNNWTVLIDNFDFNQATQEDINQIAKLVAKYTVVVVKNQKLTLEKEIEICHMFRDPEPAFDINDPNFKNSAADLNIDPLGLICRVTGEKNADGEVGIAGHTSEMSWHNNMPYDINRRSIVWLYSVRGSKGSRTSWNNTILAYNDLDRETKNKIKDLKCIYFDGVDFEETLIKNDYHQEDRKIITEFTPSLIYTNIANQTGIFLSPYQLETFVGLTKEETKEIVDPLFDFIIKDKYCYHHDWEDGDVVLSEQWLGIHKRWPFDQIEQRLLHRAAFEFPDQNYKDI